MRIAIFSLTGLRILAIWIGMYVRTISRRNKDGSTTTYVQLAHNVWDPNAGCAKANVLYVLGEKSY